MQDAHDDAVGAETGTCLNETRNKEEVRLHDVIGGHGPWQLFHWSIFFLASLCLSMHLFSTLPLMSHTACPCTNNTGNNRLDVSTKSSRCNISLCQVETNGWNDLKDPCFSPQPTSALEIAHEDNSRCSNVATVLYAKCLFFFGVIIAVMAAYPLLKRYGRRSISLISCFLLCACSISGIWAFATGPYLMLKFILSIGVVSVYLISAFSMCDSVSEEFRLLYFYIGHVGWGVAHITLPLLTLIIPSWTLFNVALTVPCFLLLILLCFISESPESYAARGLWAKAHSVMRKAARYNGYSLQKVEQYTPDLLLQEKKENNSNFSWKIENYRHITERAALFIMGFLSSFVYFTSTWLTDWLQIKRNSHFSLSGTTDIAAALVLLSLSYYIPVRRLWALATSFSSICLLIMFSREKYEFPKLSRSSYLIQMFFSSTAWTVLLIHVLSEPLKSKNSKCTAITVGLGLCFGVLAAALADIQKLFIWDRCILLIMSVPNLVAGMAIGLVPSRFLDCLNI